MRPGSLHSDPRTFVPTPEWSLTDLRAAVSAISGPTPSGQLPIDVVELEAYEGRAGQVISILATDEIEVVDVTVTIRTATGTTMESAPATADHGVWVYRATEKIARGTPIRIEVTARNRARAAATQTIAR